MKIDTPLNLYLRILLVSTLVVLLGISARPSAADRYLAYAHQSLATGDLLSASRDLARSAEYFPWRYDLNLAAGRYALQAGDAKSAILYLVRPGTFSHLTSEDLLLLGDAYAQSADPNMAESIWKRVIDLGEYSPAYQRLADLYLQRADYSTALDYLKEYLRLNPSNGSLYYRIGLLFAVTDPVKSLPYLIQAVQMDQPDASKAQALHDKIRTANLFDEPAYTFLVSGRQLANWGEWKLAAAAFQKAIDLQPQYSDAWAFLGEALQQIAGQEAGSPPGIGLAELNKAVQLDASSTLANTFMALYWERQDDYTQAQHYLEHAISSSPKDSYLYSELGSVLSRAGDLPSAQSAYETAIQLSPDDPLFFRLLANYALEHQIQIRELALPAARQAILLNPADPNSLDVMAQVMLMLSDYHSAERFSASAIRSDPGYAPAYLHLGMAYLHLGQSGLARQWLSLAKAVGLDTWVAAQSARLLDYYFP